MKAQASMELFTTVGIAVAFLVPIIFLLFSVSNSQMDELSKSQADISVKRIANGINNVYLSGANSTTSILLNLPSNAKSLNISGQEVIMVLRIGDRDFESSYPLIFDDRTIIAGLNTDKTGLFWITIKNEDNQLLISD